MDELLRGFLIGQLILAGASASRQGRVENERGDGRAGAPREDYAALYEDDGGEA